MSDLLVSVVMPTYNGGKFLPLAVESILNQSYKNLELIVIDDGSTDGSVERLSAFSDSRLRIIKNPSNSGVVYSRNIGILSAAGQLVAMLDSDDLAYPDRLQKQVDVFYQDPDLSLLGSAADVIDSDGRLVSSMGVTGDSAAIKKNILISNQFIQSSVMFKRDLAINLGMYSSQYPLAEDYAFWIKFVIANKVSNLTEKLVAYRVHESQVSQKKIKLMNSCAWQVREDAWKIILGENLNQDFLSPVANGFFLKIFGKNGSLGGDFLWWASLYKKMKLYRPMLAMVSRGIFYSPFSLSLYELLMPYHFRPSTYFNYISKRLK